MHKFKIVIGDWSGDGHGKNESFLIDSNYPVEIVREAYFSMKDKLGIGMQDFCNKYHDPIIPMSIVGKLRNLGYNEEFEEYDNTGHYVNIEDMLDIYLFLLKKSNPELELKVIQDEVKTLHFWGGDEQGKSFNFVGYGLFD